MDNPETVTHISLCAGYGGIDLGLKRAIGDVRTVAFCEIEAFACANLVAKMEAGQLDPAPVWTDLKTFPWGAFHGRVDILSGGYPCQPFSAAGKRLGADDPRHLWPFIATGIRLMQPRFCFFENVEGHISLGLRAVIEELAELGYTATWGIFSAAEVGAPHQRKRVFILAHRREQGLERYAQHELLCDQPGRNAAGQNGPSADAGLLGACWPSRPGQPQHEWEPPRVVGNATVMQRDGSDDYSRISHSGESLPEPGDTGGATGMGDTADGDGASREKTGCQEINAGGSDWVRGSQAQPPLGGDADGLAHRLDYAELCVSCDNRVDELRLLGNGVCPATATKAFVTLWNELHEEITIEWTKEYVA